MDIRLYQTHDVIKAACYLAEKLYNQKQRILILCPNPLMVEAMDQALWQFKQLSFIPHMTDVDNIDPKTQQIFISCNTKENANDTNAVLCCDVVPNHILDVPVFLGVLSFPLCQEFTEKFQPTQHFVQKEEGGWVENKKAVSNEFATYDRS